MDKWITCFTVWQVIDKQYFIVRVKLWIRQCITKKQLLSYPQLFVCPQTGVDNFEFFTGLSRGFQQKGGDNWRWEERTAAVQPAYRTGRMKGIKKSLANGAREWERAMLRCQRFCSTLFIIASGLMPVRQA